MTGDKEAYIGETVFCYKRMCKHLHDCKRKSLKEIHVIYDEIFHMSATKDLESFLIRNMAADNKFKLQNRNSGIVDHEYFERKRYLNMQQDLWKMVMNLGLAIKSLNNIKDTIDYKFSPFINLTNFQVVTANNLFVAMGKNHKLHTFIINGKAGAGKTSFAIYMMQMLQSALCDADDLEENLLSDALKKIIKSDMKIGLVIPTSSLRKTIKSIFRKIAGLHPNMVLSPLEAMMDHYDLLIVDDAHNLRRNRCLGFHTNIFLTTNKRLGLSNEGNELDWIMKSSDSVILLYDESQAIRSLNIPANVFDKLKENKTETAQFFLNSQPMRSENYVEYIENILHDKQYTKVAFEGYDLQIFDNIKDMLEEIKKVNAEYGVSKLLAGNAWKLKMKNLDQEFDGDNQAYDFIIEDQKFRWNTQISSCAHTENTIDIVEPVYSIQGYDLNYAGVIFGDEIAYDEQTNRIIIKEEVFHDIYNKKGFSEENTLQNYICNIYYILMTRGIRGTYIYACDEALRNHLKKYIKVHIPDKENVNNSLS